MDCIIAKILKMGFDGNKSENGILGQGETFTDQTTLYY